jgi:hypothetical protein
MTKRLSLRLRSYKEKLDDFFDIYLILSIALIVTGIYLFFFYYG